VNSININTYFFLYAVLNINIKCLNQLSSVGHFVLMFVFNADCSFFLCFM